MVQILYGDAQHRARCTALAAVTPGSSVVAASGPAFDKRVLRIDTLTFWGHGDAHGFCGMRAAEFVAKVKEWRKWNPTIGTVEIITCNARHDTELPIGGGQTLWVKSFTDQAKPPLQKAGLVVKALPMGVGNARASRWSVLKFSGTTNTWLYVTAGGAQDTDEMWPAVNALEAEQSFKTTKNYTTAGAIVKARDTMRKYTLDFGTVATLRAALVVLA
jgi:hypothetical protein